MVAFYSKAVLDSKYRIPNNLIPPLCKGVCETVFEIHPLFVMCERVGFFNNMSSFNTSVSSCTVSGVIELRSIERSI